MLDQVARHGLIDLTVKATGDLHIDAHHTVEDVGITLDKRSPRHWATRPASAASHAYVPLDEGFCHAWSSIFGRPGLEYHVTSPAPRVGKFDRFVHRVLPGFVNHALATLASTICVG